MQNQNIPTCRLGTVLIHGAPLRRRRRRLRGRFDSWLSLLTACLLGLSLAATAEDTYYEQSIKNTTGNEANDLHVHFSGNGVHKAAAVPFSNTPTKENPDGSGGPPFIAWNFSGGTVPDGGSATVKFTSGGTTKEVVDSAIWTSNGLNVGYAKKEDISARKKCPNVRSYGKTEGGTGLRVPGAWIWNGDPIQTLRFDDFQAWIGHGAAGLDVNNFDIPTGVPVLGPSTLLLPPGGMFDTGFLPSMPEGTFLLMKAMLTEISPDGTEFTSEWAFATDTFMPMDGQRLWLKADAIIGLNPGDPVAFWADSSGTANNGVNALVANQPRYVSGAVNGLPAVRFADGGNAANAGQYLDTTLPINANRRPLTIFVVFKSEVSATARDTLLQPLDDGSNPGRTVLYMQNDAGAEYRVATASSGGGGPAWRPCLPGSWALVSMAQDPAAGVVEFWRDGAPDGAAPMGGEAQPNGPWRIGDNKPRTGGLQGDIAEILVYDGVLPASQRRAVEDYLLSKYDLSPSGVVNLFRDNFNVSVQSSDVNFENGLGRQSGSAGVLGYLETTGGATDSLSQVNTPDAPKGLRLEVNGTQVYTAVAPNHNFVEGGNFSIEFDLDAGLNDPAGLSDDWACVVFGASSPLAFVNASDGMGILFRNNGAIQVFDGAADTKGGGVLPLGPVHIRIEAECAGFQGSPALVRMFVNGERVQLGAATMDYVKPAGFRGNHVTLGCYAATGNTWVNAFDNFMICATPCIRPSVGSLKSYVGQMDQAVTVTIPPLLNAAGAVDVVIASLNPAVAEPLGAVGGNLVLTFPQGGPLSETFFVSALSKGTAVLDLRGPGDVCVGGTVTVRVGGALVANPSFEDNGTASWPGYAGISAWTVAGGGGLNPITVEDPRGRSPFADNGVIPDRGQVAFVQNAGSLSQIISGLDPSRQYWLQLHANARSCCSGVFPSASASYNGVELGSIASVAPVGAGKPYYMVTVPFVPGAPEGQLALVSAPIPGEPDRTLLVDAVSIVQRDSDQVVIQNPSFEASGVLPYPGYIQPGMLAGWTVSGGCGVNVSGEGPFADNGKNPDQDNVAFLQGAATLSQTIPNLTVGNSYVLSFACNARGGNMPSLEVSLDGVIVHQAEVLAVGADAPYQLVSIPFVANAPAAVLSFAQTAPGDQSVLLDDVKIAAAPPYQPELRIALLPGQPAVVRISWPFAAGTAWILQSSPGVLGGFGDAGQMVGTEGEEFVVYEEAPSGNKFYRLVK